MSARPLTDSLFAAARDDGPSERAREEMWRNVAVTTGLAATAAAATTASSAVTPTSAVATAAAGGTKLLVVGGLLGASCTALGVVLALVLTSVDRAPPLASASPVSERAPSRAARAVAIGARLADPRPRGREAARLPTPSATTPSATTPSATTPSATTPHAARPPADRVSDLAEEAKLVTEARAALVAGDATRALTLVQSAHKFPARALEPEELSLEARALRALGRVDEAIAVERVLRARFPGHALSR